MSKRIEIGLATDIAAGQLKKVEVANTSMVVARVGNGFCAVANKCPHLGLPLAGGKLDAERGTITCPFHNSRFDLCTGANLDWGNRHRWHSHAEVVAKAHCAGQTTCAG